MRSFSDLSALLPAFCLISLSVGDLGLVYANTKESSAPLPSSPSSPLTLEPLLVTASRQVESPFLSPYTTDIVTEKEVLEYSQRSIPDALRWTPGVLVQKTTYGHGSPYIRGFTGRQNLLLLDGLRLNNSTWRSGPSQYWNTIDVLSLSQLELVKGQGSVLFGSDSVGGTLNLLSQSTEVRSFASGEAYQTGSAYYRYASNGHSHIGRLESNTGVGGVFGLHLGISAKDFGDIRAAHLGSQKHTGYSEYDYDAKAEWLVNDKNTLTLTSRALSQDDVWRTHKTVYGPTWQGTTQGSDKNYHYDQSHCLNSLSLSGKELAAPIQNYTFSLGFFHNKENEYSLSSKNITTLNTTWVNTWAATLQLESALPHGKILYGFDYYLDSIDSKTQKDGKKSTPSLPNGSQYDLLGLYADYLCPLAEERWEVRLGSRFTYAKAHLGAEEQTPSLDKDWTNFVFSSRALFKATENTHLFAGISQAFRAPNIDDLGANQKPAQTETFVNGNPNLSPEKYLTYELGSHWQDKGWNFQLSSYFTHMQDLIVQKPLETVNGKTTSVATNAATGWVTGIEASGDWEFAPQWTLKGSLGWIYGKSDEYPDAKNPQLVEENYLSRLAPLTGTLGLRWDSAEKKYWVEARLSAADRANKLSASDRRDSSRIPSDGTPGYYWIGLYGGWKMTPNLEWMASLENITEQSYRYHGSGVNEPGFGIVTSLRATF